LVVLLASVSGNAVADWVQVSRSEYATAYADPATIRRTGDRVKLWNLFDFKTIRVSKASGKSYMSSKSQNEYDCSEEQSRPHYFSWHSENMGKGEVVVSSSDVGKWEPVPPGTMNEEIMGWACGKR